MSTTASQNTLSRNERLERLPVTGKHKRLLLGSGIGWALDAMDVGLVSFIIAALKVHWELDKTTTSWIASIGFIGMAIGASLGGLLADKIGRRQVFAATLLLYGLATGASALAWSVGALMIFRFLVGLGLGAELPVASTLISEFSPRKVRGRMVVLLEAFWAVGWILAAVIGTFVVSQGENGWRWGFALGTVPALYAIYVRLGLPESVRFLESVGRHEEAEEIVRSFEAAANLENVDRSPAPETDVAESSAHGGIWGQEMRRRTAAFWAVWFGVSLSYYGAFIWIPSLLVDQGFTLVKSFTFTLIITIAQLPGYSAAGWLIEVWGRRKTLSAFLAGSALAAILYGFAAAPWQIIATGCLLSFFNLGAWGALYAIGPELYPTSIRATGTGAGAAFGRIGSIIAPLIVPPVLAFGGPGAVFGIFAAAFALACVAAFTLPEQLGKALS
ncbi:MULTISPECIES: MFS transporter [unclassified Corynebacterium]|uniref:MFS transporter n=1 Tax=unclassified Corynebacterium TaxID=2624378 RepID=UPI0021A9F468|nr:MULTISPECIES: MFS transporter [unclassified Corynebacterium]MCT1451849.1 MFS transporter [Corynebacterium sp. p3-SID1145]MCT1460946.1 MFS transporter [Corynebacterium sp. p3-SID1140]MDN8594216.1 MFS transporter [Corynebacterium sp. P4_F2]WKK55232.1 MFS transporter [Corynebacterium sp. P4-C1]WKK62642.1 MFS transporter [Corynebacterium sp. P8-C1]